MPNKTKWSELHECRIAYYQQAVIWTETMCIPVTEFVTFFFGAPAWPHVLYREMIPNYWLAL